jgi:lipopolysaccharide/colanic/teichoic acid biosynthesis glycosyltransferase
MNRTLTGRRVESGVLPVGEVKRAIAPHVDAAAEFRPRLKKAIEAFPRPVAGVNAAESSWYLRRGKRVIDLVLVLLAAPFVLPVILLAALALMIESGSPFYKQERMRADGSRYRILKLRTMVHGADKKLAELLANDPELKREWEETQKLKKDPRITPVGGLLRVTSLDELPQLWNVFTGDMSLIGPRPMLPDQVAIYKGPIYWGMRPGISGLWQVSERNDRNFDYRAEMDRIYRRQVTFREDLSILLRTFVVMVRRTGY